MSSFAFEDVHALTDESKRVHLLELLREAPLVDGHGRNLFVVLQRRRARLSAREESKKGLLDVWIGQLARHVGCSVPEMRLDLARKFMPITRRLDHVTHQTVEQPMSISQLSDDSTPTIGEVLTQVQAWAATFFEPPLHLRSNRELPPDLRSPSHRTQRFNGEAL